MVADTRMVADRSGVVVTMNATITKKVQTANGSYFEIDKTDANGHPMFFNITPGCERLVRAGARVNIVVTTDEQE